MRSSPFFAVMGEIQLPMPSRIDELAGRLNGRRSLPPLTPDRIWHPGIDAEIDALSVTEIAGDRPDGLASAAAWKAALHLWNDSLQRAHDLVQHLETPTGYALHGIMHRREGDYDNAKYWFRRAGDHPAYHYLQSRATERLGEWRNGGSLAGTRGTAEDALRALAAQDVWNPYLFTDAVAIVEGRIGEEECRAALADVQSMELTAFLRFLEGRLS